MPAERMPTPNSRPACILVVDDEPLVVALLADFLRLEGYEVETAKNGRDALAKIQARSYDLVLSDLRMPELDGVGLYRALEQQHPGLLPRLAFVSGTTRREALKVEALMVIDRSSAFLRSLGLLGPPSQLVSARAHTTSNSLK